MESYLCPICDEEETVYHQYVKGGSTYCQVCGLWIDDLSQLEIKIRRALMEGKE